MSALEQDRVGIVGLGAIGGSLALALGAQSRVLAWSRDPADRDAARAAGIAVCRGERSTWAEELATSSVILIAVPLDEVASVVRQLLAAVPDECALVHATSLQRREALGLSETEFGRVIGAHPVAGSERSGFPAATRALFHGATVRAETRASAALRARIERLWRAAGAARLVWDDAVAHDELMAWVSHLPQLAATALAAALAQRGTASGDLGPGGREMTRLAASDFGMWAPILERAPRETVEALRCLTSTLGALGQALDARDARSLADVWGQARAWKRAEESA